jgi:hypothetical protein
MRKLGYILLVLGFAWVTFFVFGTEISPRSILNNYWQKDSAQQSYTRKDVSSAIFEAAVAVADVAQIAHVGSMFMLAGGLILSRTAKRDLPAKKPPVL